MPRSRRPTVELSSEESKTTSKMSSRKTISSRLGCFELSFVHQTAGSVLETGESLVEHQDELVDEVSVALGEESEKHWIATLGAHAPKSGRGQAASDVGKVATTVRTYHREIEAVATETTDVVELGDLGLERCGRGRGSSGVEPHDRGDPEIVVGIDEGV